MGGQREGLLRSRRKLLGMMNDVFIILKVMMISWVYTWVSRPIKLYILDNCYECQLNLNKSVKNKPTYKLQQATREAGGD